MTTCAQICDYPGVSGRFYVVTGASGGIGGGCARLLAALGAKVAVNGRNRERLDALFAQLQGAGHLLAPGDLAELDHAAWLDNIAETVGLPLSGIAHCAGLNRPAPLRGFNERRFDEDLRAPIKLAASLFSAITRMNHRADKSSVVAMSSISAVQGKPGNALYGASRAAIEALCRSYAVEYAASGIRYNCVRAGFISGTLMTRHLIDIRGEAYTDHIRDRYLLGSGKPEDAANAIVFLIGSASQWITGTTMTVDGGYGCKGI